jgi:hypothetical protein
VLSDILIQEKSSMDSFLFIPLQAKRVGSYEILTGCICYEGVVHKLCNKVFKILDTFFSRTTQLYPIPNALAGVDFSFRGS